MATTTLLQAIVFSTRPWNESDARVVFYSFQKGRMELLAKGALKQTSKLSPHLQPFNLVDLMVINSRFGPYAGAVANRACYLNINQDLDKLLSAGWLFGNLGKMLKDNEPEPKLFLLLEKFLRTLNQIHSEPLFFKFLGRACFLQALSLLGYRPDVSGKRLIFNQSRSMILPEGMSEFVVEVLEKDLIELVGKEHFKKKIIERFIIISDYLAKTAGD